MYSLYPWWPNQWLPYIHLYKSFKNVHKLSYFDFASFSPRFSKILVKIIVCLHFTMWPTLISRKKGKKHISLFRTSLTPKIGVCLQSNLWTNILKLHQCAILLKINSISNVLQLLFGYISWSLSTKTLEACQNGGRLATLLWYLNNWPCPNTHSKS